MKNVIFFVPHEDDELFVGGAMIVNLVRSDDYEVYVFIATNGDKNPCESKYRIAESIDALATLGVKPDNIYFGGYGDQWKGKHIYHATDEIVESAAGYRETYLDHDRYAEWHFLRTGEHGKYLRETYYEDIVAFIMHIEPYAVFCVDMDAHPDHKALSLFVDEAIRETLRSEKRMPQYYLKKYAYGGMLEGVGDGFRYPTMETVQDSHTADNPYLVWNDRIRYAVPKECDTIRIRDNILYKAARRYKSQGIWCNADKFINSDMVYWQRNTNDQAIKAETTASSGDAKWLNDFKLMDYSDIRTNAGVKKCCWKPVREDTDRWIRLRFDTPIEVRVIAVYFNNKESIQINDAACRVYDKKSGEVVLKQFTQKVEEYACVYIGLDAVHMTDDIEIRFPNVQGEIGISEIEVMNRIQEPPFGEYLYTEAKIIPIKRNKLRKKIDGVFFKIHRFVYRYMIDIFRSRRWISKSV